MEGEARTRVPERPRLDEWAREYASPDNMAAGSSWARLVSELARIPGEQPVELAAWNGAKGKGEGDRLGKGRPADGVGPSGERRRGALGKGARRVR